MNKSTRFISVATIMIATLLLIINWATPTQANQVETTTPMATGTPFAQPDDLEMSVPVNQQDKIKSIIQSYFDIRYQAMNTLKFDGFGNLVSDIPDAAVFLETESGKLAVEIKHAELNHLRYVDYKYYLDFTAFTAGSSSNVVTVSVSENHDVIEEISIELDPEDPFVSHRYDLEHTIILHNENGQWKIISDYYNDYLWRMLRQTGYSTNELLNTLKASPSSASRIARAGTMSSCNLPDDDSTHVYDRDGAVNYANAHSEDYNTYYPNYDGDILGGDCTNFVSQAVYEGGNASMAIPATLPPRSINGQMGWYLLNGMQRASAWNYVPDIHSFITQPEFWNEGPEGCEVALITDLMKGDLLQYNWEPDEYWDHTVIVVSGEGTDNPYVATHSPNDVRHYANFDYYVEGVSGIRFVHIERSDGEPPVKAEIELGSDDADTRDCDGVFPGNEVYLGKCDDGESITSGFRFNDIQIPQGATIKHAFITFSVDGEYTNPIHLKIYGEASGNSDTFTDSSPPDSRPTTSEESAVLWEVTDIWDLTDNHADEESKYSFTTPQLASVIQEIVDRGDWVYGNSLSIIIKDNNSTTHRRVIALERASGSVKLSPARLIITYSGGGGVPTATPTSTPTSTPTATPTATPTSIPTSTPVPTLTPSPTTIPLPTSPPFWAAAEEMLMKDEPAQKSESFSNLLSQIRDEVLTASSKGDAYIEISYQYAPEIMMILSQNEDLRQQVKKLALEVQPLLTSIVSSESEINESHLEKTWVEEAAVVLNSVKEYASLELRAEIEWWQVYLPDFTGKTGNEIWAMLPDR